MKRILPISLLIILFMPAQVLASSPMETIKSGVDATIAILTDPKYADGANEAEQTDKLRGAITKFFDFNSLSRLTLGKNNWKKLSADEKEEFKTLFQTLLENTYADRLRSYSDEKVQYEKESILTKTKAEVQTVVISQGSEIPITYRLRNRKGNWLVYDVLVEGVSLVKNFRSQFSDILAKKTPQELFDSMRKQIEDKS
jgi:phospholipid transport system substrate-binding protein